MNPLELPAAAPMENTLGNIQDFGMDTISLAGTLPAKLAAVRNAGFSQIMVSARDVVGYAEGIDAAVAAVRGSGLRVTGFQVLRDFEGLSGQLHEYKIDVAKSMLEMCRAVGAKVAAARGSSWFSRNRASRRWYSTSACRWPRIGPGSAADRRSYSFLS